ncbi:MAG: AAA family ATPase [Cyanobacteria bacterium]|nr:AAA family ATPase [Cyanobacteriota bacterium]
MNITGLKQTGYKPTGDFIRPMHSSGPHLVFRPTENKDLVLFGTSNVKPAEPSERKINLTADAAAWLTYCESMVAPVPAETHWTMNLISLLCGDASVRRYLADTSNIDPDTIIGGIRDHLRPKLVEKAVEQKTWPAHYYRTVIRPALMKFCEQEGAQEGFITDVTPVLLWRWLMKTDPTQNIESMLKLSGFDATRIAKLREAPAAKAASSRSKPASAEEVLALENALTTLPKRILGQDRAIQSIISGIRRARLGYGGDPEKPNQPQVRFLLLGASGSGKTASIKRLAKALGREVVVISMTEYTDKQDVKKFTGAAHGYTGFGEACALDKIKQAFDRSAREGLPPPIILFDEIEKAHEDVRKALMQILDEGVMDNAKQEKIIFRDADIFMTSNIAQTELRLAQEAGATDEQLEAITELTLRKAFTPDFIGRINKRIFYAPVSEENARKILDMNLTELSARIQTKDQMQLNVSQTLKDAIMAKGYSRDTGCRELIAVTEAMVEEPLVELKSQLIKAGTTLSGGTMHGDWNTAEKKSIFQFIPKSNSFK